jgi:CTP-dependent riboflavin kinase
MKALCIVMIATIFSAPVMAEIDSMDVEMMEMDQPINVSGQQRQKRLTAAQKMKLIRQRREKQNELYAKKKIEQWRLQQEIEMTKRIKKIFDAQMKALDNI